MSAWPGRRRVTRLTWPFNASTAMTSCQFCQSRFSIQSPMGLPRVTP